MIAIDTNILVRFLVDDDDIQCKRVQELFLEHPIYIAKTVLLETEWILRANFALPRDVIYTAFKKLLSLKPVHFEEQMTILNAVTYFEMGLDFADALHLASAPSHATFMSFDKKLIQKAKQWQQKVDLL